MTIAELLIPVAGSGVAMFMGLVMKPWIARHQTRDYKVTVAGQETRVRLAPGTSDAEANTAIVDAIRSLSAVPPR